MLKIKKTNPIAFGAAARSHSAEHGALISTARARDPDRHEAVGQIPGIAF